MPEDTQIENNNTSDPVNLEIHHQDDDFNFEEDADNNTWIPTENIAKLLTEVYCGNLLKPSVRKQILQAEPRNRDIAFTPLKMEQRMQFFMPKNDRKTNKNYSKLLYRFSSVIRPIDNALRIIYDRESEDKSDEEYEKWLQLQQTVLNSKALALDALSFRNDLRRELALKNLSPNYRKPSVQKGVFGDDLSNIIREENEINKLINNAPIRKRGLVSFPSQIIHPLSDLIHNNNLSKTIGGEGIGNIGTGCKTTIKGIRETLLRAVHQIARVKQQFQDSQKVTPFQKQVNLSFWSKLGHKDRTTRLFPGETCTQGSLIHVP
jgi:hypothetical protein